MRMRLAVGLLAGLLAAMLPGVTAAAEDGVHFEKKSVAGCELGIEASAHWTKDLNPSDVNEELRLGSQQHNPDTDCVRDPLAVYLDTGSGPLFSGHACEGSEAAGSHPMCKR